MTYETLGQVEFIGNTEEFGTKGFKKREFTLLIQDGEYTNSIKFEFTGDKCERLDQVNIGDEVLVKFALSGRTKSTSPKLINYTNLRAFYVKVLSESNSSETPNTSEPEPEEKPEPRFPEFDANGDEIPF